MGRCSSQRAAPCRSPAPGRRFAGCAGVRTPSTARAAVRRRIWLHILASLPASIRRIRTRIGWPRAFAKLASSSSAAGSSTGVASRSSARELSGGQQAAGSGGGCERLRFEVADIVYRRLTISMPKPTRPIERMRAIRDSRLLDASAAAHPSHLFASAPPRRLDGADVDLLHRHHRLEGASVFFGFMLVCSLCAIRADAAVSRRMHRANSPSGVVRRGSWLSAQAFFQRSRARCPGIRSPRSETALMRCPSPRAAGRA